MGILARAPQFGVFLYFVIMGLAGCYLAYAAVQGDYGLFRRIEVEAETRRLSEELLRLTTREEHLGLLNHRLSDDFLDLDLLDERVRDVLGYVHPGEIVLR